MATPRPINTEPNQLTIENFLEFLNSHSQELLPPNEQDESSQNRAQESNPGGDTESSESENGGGKIPAKDEGSFENWSLFDSKLLMDRKETAKYAQKTGKRFAKPSNCLIPPFILEYEEEAPTKEKQEKFLTETMRDQRNGLIEFHSNYPFSVALYKRLSILETVFKSLSKKFHCLKVAKSGKKTKLTETKNKKASQSVMPQGTDVMVQLGVKTGLSLLFSLMKQAWMQSSQSSELCSDVLSTVASIINTLPPLSLANNAKLPKLAKDSLDQVMDFLKEVMKGKVAVDVTDRRLCADILIGCSLQRGSLLAILDWVETGFRSSLLPDQMSVEKEAMNFWIRQMYSSRVI